MHSDSGLMQPGRSVLLSAESAHRTSLGWQHMATIAEQKHEGTGVIRRLPALVGTQIARDAHASAIGLR